VVFDVIASNRQAAVRRYAASWRAVDHMCEWVLEEMLGRVDLLGGLIAIAIDEVKYKKAVSHRPLRPLDQKGDLGRQGKEQGHRRLVLRRSLRRACGGPAVRHLRPGGVDPRRAQRARRRGDCLPRHVPPDRLGDRCARSLGVSQTIQHTQDRRFWRCDGGDLLACPSLFLHRAFGQLSRALRTLLAPAAQCELRAAHKTCLLTRPFFPDYKRTRDQVRRGEWNELRRTGGAEAANELKGLRWMLLRNWENARRARKGGAP
jgi:hypothetical protein